MSLSTTVLRTFEDYFGHWPAHLVKAPGRVNLIGEHTDYNSGYVLPCAIDLGTWVAASPRTDGQIKVMALDLARQTVQFPVATHIEPDTTHGWSNYVRGVVQIFATRGWLKNGANLVVSGNIPQGAGLSSSASLEVAIGLILSLLSGVPNDPKTIARIAQQAENDYVGCQCGIMDQLASSSGVAHHCLLIDCQNLDVEPVSMPDDMAIVIVNSNVRRGLVDSAYNERREQCEGAARHLGLASLREATMPHLLAYEGSMDPVEFRRARHVVAENVRTLEMAQALSSGRSHEIGPLMAASHWSLHSDFEVTVPQLDLLVNMIEPEVRGVGGVRMTGGGFGGCVVALAPKTHIETIRAAVLRDYQRLSGIEPDIYVCFADHGARALEI